MYDDEIRVIYNAVRPRFKTNSAAVEFVADRLRVSRNRVWLAKRERLPRRRRPPDRHEDDSVRFWSRFGVPADRLRQLRRDAFSLDQREASRRERSSPGSSRGPRNDEEA